MNRNDFIKRLASDIKFTEEERIEIIARGIYENGVDKACVIVMEEFAELQQQVSKQIRKCGDQIPLLEEIADVYISLMFLKYIFKFGDEAIEKAIDVKCNRLADNFLVHVEQK